MKNIATAVICGLTLLAFNSCMTSSKDSVNDAQTQNENLAVDKDISTFITEAVDARMMDIAEGTLAKERGTTAAVRSYGEWMIQDQTVLLNALKKLAASKKIVVPKKLSDKKADGLKDLKEESEKDFDITFLKMMVIDHKRDVRAFKKANSFNDASVKEFASKYIPTLQAHLDKAQELKKSERKADL